MNPFERKFKEFAQNLTTKNAQGHAEMVATKSGEVFADKPFCDEFKTVYTIAKWGQSIAQVVTFLTTAALGVFALTHIIPLWWGIYIAVPLGLIFSFGMEKVKRSTLAIASKHLLKYKTFGFVGFVALLTLCVSIFAALKGAQELPGVMYPKPARAVDGASVQALSSDLDRVQADIERVQSNLKSGKNWVAENRTLPKLQSQRAALIEKRDQATKDAAGRGDAEHLEALADRQEKIDKMQVYAIGAAIVAELVFLLSTGFVFYYLFRHFALVNHAAPEEEAELLKNVMNAARTADTNLAPGGYKVGAVNGRPPVAQNLRSAPESVSYTVPVDAPRARDSALNNITHSVETVDSSLKPCAWCSTPFRPKTTWQKFCNTECKFAENESRHGTRFDPAKAKFKKKGST